MKNIITISRQYGSGGRDIAKQLAERMNFKCYDWEIIEKTAEQTGLSEQYISDACENAHSSNPFAYALERAGFSRYGVNISIKDELFKAMRTIIEDFAKEGNCVFVGRCADYILKDKADAFHVFIYANEEYRAQRIRSRYGKDLKDPHKELVRIDERRKIFYSNYTEREWGERSNYSMCLDSSAIGETRCVDIIENVIQG